MALASSYLAEAGYRVIFCNSDDHPEQEKRYLEMLFSNQVDGIISGAHSGRTGEYSNTAQILVTVDRLESCFYPEYPPDNYGGSRRHGSPHCHGCAEYCARRLTLGDHNERQRDTAWHAEADSCRSSETGPVPSLGI